MGYLVGQPARCEIERIAVHEWVWWLIAFGAALLLVDIAIRVLTITLVLPIFERRPPFNVRPTAAISEAEVVRFQTSDGLTLTGSLYRSIDDPRGVVVFCPEFCGSHWSALDYAEALVEAGFAVLSFDFRNQGESDFEPGYRPTHWLTEREISDTVAALDFVASRDELAGLPVGLFGISRGGNAALLTAARTPHVRAVAADGAFSTDGMMLYYGFRWAELYVPRWAVRLLPEWHLAGSMRLARLVSGWRHGVRYAALERGLPRLADRSVFLITGERDSYVARPVTERLRARIGRACRPIWVAPGAKHNQARMINREEYDRRLTHFFEPIAPVRTKSVAVSKTPERRIVSLSR